MPGELIVCACRATARSRRNAGSREGSGGSSPAHVVRSGLPKRAQVHRLERVPGRFLSFHSGRRTAFSPFLHPLAPSVPSRGKLAHDPWHSPRLGPPSRLPALAPIRTSVSQPGFSPPAPQGPRPVPDGPPKPGTPAADRSDPGLGDGSRKRRGSRASPTPSHGTGRRIGWDTLGPRWRGRMAPALEGAGGEAAGRVADGGEASAFRFRRAAQPSGARVRVGGGGVLRGDATRASVEGWVTCWDKRVGFQPLLVQPSQRTVSARPLPAAQQLPGWNPRWRPPG